MARKPVFNPQKAEALGIPKPLYRTLHAGEAVTLPGRRRIEREQVLDGRAQAAFRLLLHRHAAHPGDR